MDLMNGITGTGGLSPSGLALWLGVSISLFACACTTGCRDDAGRPPSGLRTVTMHIGDRDFVLEVAETEEAQQTGLMNRDSMPADRGMIFVFDDEEERGFWMKNTRIPLDILYLDRTGRIVSLKQMEPFDLRSTPSDGPAQYAIELNAGAATRAGVKRGDTLTLPANLHARRSATTTSR